MKAIQVHTVTADDFPPVRKKRKIEPKSRVASLTRISTVATSFSSAVSKGIGAVVPKASGVGGTGKRDVIARMKKRRR